MVSAESRERGGFLFRRQGQHRSSASGSDALPGRSSRVCEYRAGIPGNPAVCALNSEHRDRYAKNAIRPGDFDIRLSADWERGRGGHLLRQTDSFTKCSSRERESRRRREQSDRDERSKEPENHPARQVGGYWKQTTYKRGEFNGRRQCGNGARSTVSDDKPG